MKINSKKYKNYFVNVEKNQKTIENKNFKFEYNLLKTNQEIESDVSSEDNYYPS